jgi:hypothetical protein
MRLTVMRSAFDVLIDEGLVEEDPTSGIHIPHTPRRLTSYPLAPPEVRRLLASGRLHPADTLRPATVVLALCGATHLEIADVSSRELDLTRGLVSVGPENARRHIPLSTAQAALLGERVSSLARLRRRVRPHVAEEGTALALTRPASEYDHNSRSATIGGNLARALRSAGITRPEIRPRSVRVCSQSLLRRNQIHRRVGEVPRNLLPRHHCAPDRSHLAGTLGRRPPRRGHATRRELSRPRGSRGSSHALTSSPVPLLEPATLHAIRQTQRHRRATTVTDLARVRALAADPHVYLVASAITSHTARDHATGGRP